MDILLFVVLFGILGYIGYKNFALIKRYKQNKVYIEAYEMVLNNQDNSYEKINDFIDHEKSSEYKNKGRIIKLFSELSNGKNCEETLDQIDLKAIFYKKNKLNNQLVNLNSDSFVFIILCMAKAYENHKSSIIEDLKDKLNEIEGLQQHLEYNEIIAFSNSLLKKEDRGNTIMNSLLDGTYTDYLYEKNMIGLYKRIAAATLALNKENFDEYYAIDLHNFAKPLIGETLLKSLGLYETYKPLSDEQMSDLLSAEENKREELIRQQEEEDQE